MSLLRQRLTMDRFCALRRATAVPVVPAAATGNPARPAAGVVRVALVRSAGRDRAAAVVLAHGGGRGGSVGRRPPTTVGEPEPSELAGQAGRPAGRPAVAHGTGSVGDGIRDAARLERQGACVPECRPEALDEIRGCQSPSVTNGGDPLLCQHRAVLGPPTRVQAVEDSHDGRRHCSRVVVGGCTEGERKRGRGRERERGGGVHESFEVGFLYRVWYVALCVVQNKDTMAKAPPTTSREFLFLCFWFSGQFGPIRAQERS